MAKAPILAVDKLFDIIETIQMRDGAGVSELAAELNMAKSTVHGHLSTLKKRGYLEQDGSSQYHLSLNFLTLGGSVRQKRTIYSHVEPLLAEIANETGERVNYVVESGGDLTLVGSVLAEKGIRTAVDIGFRTDLHTTPEGKLVFAHLPESRRMELLEDIEFPVANSIGRAAFTAELDEIREAGFAAGNETIVENVTTVAVPVIYDGDFFGAVVVEGPSIRFTEDRINTIIEMLRYKVGALNIDLTYETPATVLENRIETDC